MCWSPAAAYETDQLTQRDVPLADARVQANTEVNRVLVVAVEHVNQRLRCRASAVRTHAVLARMIRRETSHHVLVRKRGFWGKYGFGAYSAWLETADLPRVDFTDARGIFGGVRPRDSLVLGRAGIASTVLLAGVRMGTDKPAHFLNVGHHYWRLSRRGRVESRAITWGTRDEATWHGLYTSKSFSYGDLAANYAGYGFYMALLTPESEVGIDDAGCAELRRPFDWGEYVADSWDEVLNPSVYTRRIGERVDAFLTERLDEYCAVWRATGLEPVPLTRNPSEVGVHAPARTDPYEALHGCGGSPRPDGLR